MPGPDLPETPAPLKSIQPYLKTASEHDARDVVVSYWCRLYALQTGLKLSTKTGEETNFLLKLMDWLESTKKAHHENEAITNEVAAQAHLENWALKLFLYADKHDRASNFGKNVIQSFYTAGLLYDVLTTFGELSEEASQNKKYAKWKAAYIHNCLKNGQTPVPGPAKEDGDDNSNENVGSDLLDYDENADHENNDPGVQPSQPTLPAMPMQPPMIPTRPTQPTPPTTMGAYDFPSVPAKDEDNKDNDENNERDENNEGVENNEEPAENDENKDDENNENLDNDENNENDESIENNENVETNESDENDESHENNDNNEEAAENEENQDDGKDEKSEPHPYNPAPTPTNPGNNRVTYDDKSVGIKSETGVELTVELSGKAQKYIKWAGSSLNYDDVPTAILNLRKALHLLTTGEDPA